jgi:hypothetical protein
MIGDNNIMITLSSTATLPVKSNVHRDWFDYFYIKLQ